MLYLCSNKFFIQHEHMIRKILICTIMLVALTGANYLNAQFRYVPMVGGDISTLHLKQTDIITVDKSAGFSGGLVGEMMFSGIGFGIDLGLYYEQRGATLNLGEKELWASQGYGRTRTYLHYAVIPIHLRFKYTRLNGLEDKIAPFVFAGPSFGFLVANNNVKALDYAGGDVGVDFGLGFELFKHVQISGSFNLGATYALKAKILSDFSGQNRTWNFRIAYLF